MFRSYGAAMGIHTRFICGVVFEVDGVATQNYPINYAFNTIVSCLEWKIGSSPCVHT